MYQDDALIKSDSKRNIWLIAYWVFEVLLHRTSDYETMGWCELLLENVGGL